MGWGRMLLLGDVGQQFDIRDLERCVGEMQSAFEQNQSTDLDQAKQIAALQRENQELKLYLATLVKLLGNKGVLTQQEIAQTVKAIET